MNDNAELLKFAVENIEEWPEEWTHLRSEPEGCIYTSGNNWWIDDTYNWQTLNGVWKYLGISHSTADCQVISRNEWEDVRKECTIQLTEEEPKPNTFTKGMLEAGKHVVVTGDGKESLVTKDRLVDCNDRYILLGDLDDNMSSIYPELSVVKVIEVTRTTIWSR